MMSSFWLVLAVRVSYNESIKKEAYPMKKLQEMSNQEFYTYAKTLIPGGSQLLSKRPEHFAMTPNQYRTKKQGAP